MMKKKILIFIFILLSIFLVSCIKKELPLDENRTIIVNFINKSDEYNVSNSTVDIHYFADDNLPYIDVLEFINMLEGVYYSSEFEYFKDFENQILKISIEVEYEKEIEIYEIIWNFKNDTVFVESLDFFSSYIKITATDYSKGLISLDSIITKGTSVNYDLAKYNFDLVIKNELFLVPFHIINLFMNQEVYFDAYFNGDIIYGIDTSNLDTNNDTSLVDTIIKSSNNNKDLSENLKVHSYNFYALIIDYFYGLKTERNINSAYEFLESNKNNFLNNTSKNIFEVTERLDDLHTSHLLRSYYNYNKTSKYTYESLYTGKNTKNFYDGLYDVQMEAIDYFGYDRFTGVINIKDIEIINSGKTTVIYLLGFDVDTPELIGNYIKELPETVENIIIDLTLNTGGNLGAVLRMFTLMTDKEIYYHYQNPLDGSKYSYGVVGENKSYNQYNYFIKSSSVTFSAANLAVSIAKELDIPVIGRKSSGGASSIGFFLFPEGSIIIMSSNTVLSKIEEDNYVSIELGLEPDYHLINLYNEESIKNIIDSFKNF